MKLVDEETRAIVRNARLDALEADNYGTEDPETADEADGAYVDEESQGSGSKDKKKARIGLKRSQPTAAVKSTRWKVKSLAQLLFEEVLLSMESVEPLDVSTDASLSAAWSCWGRERSAQLLLSSGWSVLQACEALLLHLWQSGDLLVSPLRLSLLPRPVRRPAQGERVPQIRTLLVAMSSVGLYYEQVNRGL